MHGNSVVLPEGLYAATQTGTRPWVTALPLRTVHEKHERHENISRGWSLAM
ncbi:MAG: hypothetical protein ACXV8J_06895 [Methylobacter sp.]